MSVADYIPVLIQILLALGIGVSIIVGNIIFGQKGLPNPIKDSAYECGMLGVGNSHSRFAVKFYVTAMLFILFDIEVVFLLPWILVLRDFLAQGIPILLPGLVFIGILVVGLIYELRKGALNWER
jgi:NADH-quinone oxidoreductase subunit A